MIIIYGSWSLYMIIIYIIAEVFPAAITNHPSGGCPQLHRPSLGGVSGDQHGRGQCAKTTGAGEISRDLARFCVKVVCFCCHIEDFGSNWLVQWSHYQYFPRWLVVTWHLKRWFEALVIQGILCAINFGINTGCHLFLNIWICLFETVDVWVNLIKVFSFQIPRTRFGNQDPRFHQLSETIDILIWDSELSTNGINFSKDPVNL